jgi:hypothetical protein
MSMHMRTLNVCTLSNTRVASNTHCFVAATHTAMLYFPGVAALER